LRRGPRRRRHPEPPRGAERAQLRDEARAGGAAARPRRRHRRGLRAPDRSGRRLLRGGRHQAHGAHGNPPRRGAEAPLRFEHQIPAGLHRLEKPTLAALPGPAAGAGFSLALACDLRIAAESAFVTTAYAKLGLSGDYGGAWFLTQLVGPAKAREILFLADRLDARVERLGRNRVARNRARAGRSPGARLAASPPVALRY
jgi:hypothetical protein